jgi:hypothetical protein
MAKTLLRNEARLLRQNGKSVVSIAYKLHISKSTASIWVRDIVLSTEQLGILRNKAITGAEKGRLKGAFIQKQKRLNLIKENELEGEKYFKVISKKSLLIAGLAIYWAEGSKKSREIKIVNSDPKMILLMINWLKICFGISDLDIMGSVNINITHKTRERDVLTYWSNLTKIPLNRFRKTNFIHSEIKKKYDNYKSYFGTFNIHVLKPARFYYKILGYIHGLSKARIAQW